MDRSNDKLLLKKILSRYDQLGFIRKQIFESKENFSAIEKLRQQSCKQINEIDREFKEHEFQGPLATLLKRYRLDKYQLVIILALLRQRLVSSNPSLTGRELLQLIFDESYGILQGMALIDSTSILVSTGIIIPEISSGEIDELLDSKFRLSDRVFSMIYNTFASTPGWEAAGHRKGHGPYRTNMAYLMDQRKISLLYQKRATKVFNYDYWDEIGLGVSESVEGINRQLNTMRNHIQKRLEKTKQKDRIYTWNFSRKYNLSEEEMVVLVTLFFQEITEGNAFLNAVDLLRLTAQNEEELVRKRKFFSPKRPLVQNKLVQLEEMVNGKELTAEVCLPNWVIERILHGTDEVEGGIDMDARLDFHNYLKNIESSEDFLDDLDL